MTKKNDIGFAEIRNLSKEDLERISERGVFGRHTRSLEALERAKRRRERRLESLKDEERSLADNQTSEWPTKVEEELERIGEEMAEAESSLYELDREILRLRLDAAYVRDPDREGAAVLETLGIAWQKLRRLWAVIRKDSLNRTFLRAKSERQIRLVFTEERIRIREAERFFDALMDALGAAEEWSRYNDVADALVEYLEALSRWYAARIQGLRAKLCSMARRRGHDLTLHCQAARTLLSERGNELNRKGRAAGIRARV